MKWWIALFLGVIAVGYCFQVGEAQARPLPAPYCGRHGVPSSWPTLGGNGQHTRNDCEDLGLDGHLSLQWKQTMAGVLEFPPVYYGGVLYTAQDSGWISARALSTGDVIWSRHFDTEFNSSPTYRDGMIYVEGFKNHFGLAAFSAATGDIVWQRTTWTGGEASPIVHRGNVIEANDGGQVAAFDDQTGACTWSDQLGGGGTKSDHFSAAPTYNHGRIYVSNYKGGVWELRARTGSVIWHKHFAWSSDYASMAFSSGRLFLASRLGYAASISAYNGSLIWVRKIGYLAYGSPAVSRGSVYTDDFAGNYWKLNEYTGGVQWHFSPGSHSMSSPVVIGHRVYFSDTGKIKTQAGAVEGFNTKTQKLCFYFKDGKYTPAIDADGDLILVGFGHMYRFDAT